eukprot:495223-Rhodomonas_salina.4
MDFKEIRVSRLQSRNCEIKHKNKHAWYRLYCEFVVLTFVWILYTCYAMPSTDIPFGAIGESECAGDRSGGGACGYGISLRACYAMSGTGIAYSAYAQSPVLV